MNNKSGEKLKKWVGFLWNQTFFITFAPHLFILSMQTLTILLGPTAVGKTELALRMAEERNSPILSCDSRQIYRDIPICTAAPTLAERQRVPHYFVGTHGLEEHYSAAQYERDVLSLMASCPDQDFVMTGGSMMYIDAVVNGIDDIPDADPAIRQQLRALHEAEGLDPLLRQLESLDPVYYARVDKKNTQRVIHGLEMCLTTGRSFSSFHTGQKKTRPFQIEQIGLRREREVLYERIDRRVDQMFADGLEEETHRVYEQYREQIEQQFAQVVRNPGPTQAQPIPNLVPSALNTVGLKEMLLYFAGIYTKEQARERICHNTHIYSKKQMTWFARNKNIQWMEI